MKRSSVTSSALCHFAFRHVKLPHLSNNDNQNSVITRKHAASNTHNMALNITNRIPLDPSHGNIPGLPSTSMKLPAHDLILKSLNFALQNGRIPEIVKHGKQQTSHHLPNAFPELPDHL